MTQKALITQQYPQIAAFTKPEQKYLSVNGVRTFIKGYCDLDYSKSRLYALTMNDEIPHIKGPGGRLIFPIAEIIKWIESGEQK